jgi:hypothetical protein
MQPAVALLATSIAEAFGPITLALTAIAAAKLTEDYSRKHAKELVGEGAVKKALGVKIQGSEFNQNNFPPFSEAFRKAHEAEINANTPSILKAAAAHDAETKTIYGVNGALIGLGQNANSAANWLSLLTSRMGGFPIGGSGAGGSWLPQTQYGPGVPGDNIPHQGTWDADSAAGIGHIHGKAYSLNGYPAGYATAMHPAFARGHYHINPGDEYISDKDHKRHRWLDTSGAKNPKNEDNFTGKPVTINQTININGHGHDAKAIAEHVRGHNEDLSRMLNRALAEDSRLSYA